MSKPKLQRLDAAVFASRLARSRTQAALLVTAGEVKVDGRMVTKPAYLVDPDSVITVTAGYQYVSRAAQKLIAALDSSGVKPAGRLALDAGASTGGFTQVLLERGARKVLAVDVGHGQLAPELMIRDDVVLIEGCNIRSLDTVSLGKLAGTAEKPTLVTADLSFISLTQVLPVLVSLAETETDFLLLVKPQFEVGRAGVRDGIVHSPKLRAEAVLGVLRVAGELGMQISGLFPSPILGAHGNRELLVHLVAHEYSDPKASWFNYQGSIPQEWMARIDEWAGG